MRITQHEASRFCGYMFFGLLAFFLLGGLAPLVFAGAICFVIVIAIASAVGLPRH